MTTHSKPKLSAQIKDLVLRYKNRDLTLGQLVEELHEIGPWLLCLIMSTPFLLPVPLPGVSTPFGIIILIASGQIAFHAKPWIPRRWRGIKVSASIMEKILNKLISLLIYTEKFIKPRFNHLLHISTQTRISAIALAILAFLLALPMPPGFNAPPALAIIALALGHIEEDGIMVAIALILSVLNTALFAAVFYFGVEGFTKLFLG